MRQIHLVTSLAVLLGISASSCAIAINPTAEWSVSFGDSGRPNISPSAPPKLTGDGSGNWLTYFQTIDGPPIMAKLNASGVPQWTARPAWVALNPSAHILSDGSLISLSDVVSLYDAEGRFVWASPPAFAGYGASAFVEVGNELIVLRSIWPAMAYRIDRFSGLVLETAMNSAHLSACEDWVATSTSTDTIYVADTCAQPLVSKIRLNPLRVEWTVAAPISGQQSLKNIVADSTGAYIGLNDASGSTVRKLAQGTGDAIWSTDSGPQTAASVALDTDGDLLAFGQQSIRKLDRGNGSVLWTHASTGVISGVTTSVDGIFVTGSNHEAPPATQSGFIKRLQRTNGQMIWQIALPNTVAGNIAMSDITVHADRVLASGATCAFDEPGDRCKSAFWSTTINGTSATVHSPAFPMRSFGRATLASGDTTLAAAIESGVQGSQIRVKRIANADGSLLWDSVHPVPTPGGNTLDEERVDIFESDDGSVTVAYRKLPEADGFQTSQVIILKLEGTTGQSLWQKSLLEPDDSFPDIDARIAVDASGNVFASVHRKFENLIQPPPSARELRKYASATGQETLRITLRPRQDPWIDEVSPPSFKIVANDVLIREALALSNEIGLARIDGVTGQVVWRNPTLSLSDEDLIQNSTAYSLSRSTGSEIVIDKINLTDGALTWSKRFTEPDSLSNHAYLIDSLPGGDILVSGAYVDGSDVPFSNLHPHVLRFDATTGNLVWNRKFDSYAPIFLSAIGAAAFRDDALYGLQWTMDRQGRHRFFLTGISLLEGKHLGSQYVSEENADWIQHPQQRATDALGIADDQGLIVSSLQSRPGAPKQFQIEKLSPPQPFAGGSLRIELSSTTAAPANGVTTVSFVFETINDGTILAPNVWSKLKLPHAVILGNVSCDISGIPCTFINTPTSIEANVDLASGARLRLSGTFDYLKPTGILEAGARAPYSFAEMDFRNNYTSRRFETSLFSNGFD